MPACPCIIQSKTNHSTILVQAGGVLQVLSSRIYGGRVGPALKVRNVAAKGFVVERLGWNSALVLLLHKY